MTQRHRANAWAMWGSCSWKKEAWKAGRITHMMVPSCGACVGGQERVRDHQWRRSLWVSPDAPLPPQIGHEITRPQRRLKETYPELAICKPQCVLWKKAPNWHLFHTKLQDLSLIQSAAKSQVHTIVESWALTFLSGSRWEILNNLLAQNTQSYTRNVCM